MDSFVVQERPAIRYYTKSQRGRPQGCAPTNANAIWYNATIRSILHCLNAIKYSIKILFRQDHSK